MLHKALVYLRAQNQQIVSCRFKHPENLVSWMGALQAQDFAMARWAAGLRLPGATEDLIIKAINSGDILRTHILRPTWHFVSSEDIYWMLELTAPPIIRSMTGRHKELGISSGVLKKTNSIIEKLLENSGYVTREEVVLQLLKNKIRTDENRTSHLLFSAELAGIICSGKIINNKHTYALLTERVKRKKTLSRGEALARLAEKYFQSHGPAAQDDFTWWSGLPVKDAREAVESVRSEFISGKVNGREYFFNEITGTPKSNNKAYLLPAYDEFIISYKDRSHLLASDDHKKVISLNGIFRPVILINGIVKGIWKRTVKKNIMEIEVDLFQPQGNSVKKQIELASGMYGEFLNKEVKIIYHK